MKRLAIFAFAVGIVWILFYFHEYRRRDPIDLAILCALILIWSTSALSMLWEEEDWTVRALGILGMVAGDAVLYSAFVYGGWTRNPVPEGMTDLARALFVVGAPLFGISRVFWFLSRRRVRRGKEVP